MIIARPKPPPFFVAYFRLALPVLSSPDYLHRSVSDLLHDLFPTTVTYVLSCKYHLNQSLIYHRNPSWAN